jgi:hypothetical protein
MVSAKTTGLKFLFKDEEKVEMAMAASMASAKGWAGGGTLFSSLQRRDYRLIDCLHQPHPHLDGLYESMDEALADAIGWLESMGPSAFDTSIGLEVSTPSGSWRTIRQPGLLLCPLPRQQTKH